MYRTDDFGFSKVEAMPDWGTIDLSRPLQELCLLAQTCSAPQNHEAVPRQSNLSQASNTPHMTGKRLHIVHCLPEDLHGWLGVGVVGRLEAQLLQPQPVKKHFEGANEVFQG